MSEPSRFYRQHFAIEAPRIDERAFRPFWRIRTRSRLDRLLDERAISPAAWVAAVRFRDAVAYLAGFDRGYDRTVGGAGTDRATYRFEARAFVFRAQATLGLFAAELVWSCAVDDLPWTVVGARLRVHAKTARRWTIVALEALASMNK